MTLGIAALVVWAVLAAFTALDFLPVWIPLVSGAVIFAIGVVANQARRALAALLGGALLLGGV